ncbi:MAG: hypothetical protein JOZ84_01235 [Methylobacteriaceae bacterium]|nr:hypothetical protein [Methylobacteriaceae bacterium]
MRRGHLFKGLIAALFGSAMIAAESDMVELAVPRRPEKNEAVQLRITTALPRGARLVVKDAHGGILGAVTPFQLQAGATTATVPIPSSAMADQRLRLQLEVTERGASPRAPRQGEIKQLELNIEPE